jgi:uncharacterized LabA/DUF88 family protein
MRKFENNYAFIDAQNTQKGTEQLGWKINWQRFRVYLKHKYFVETAFLFMGYIPSNQRLYTKLQQAGFVIIFKPVILTNTTKPKGNCDADLVLNVMLEKDNFDQAVIVTSDGDFYSLVKYLYREKKLKAVLSAHINHCSGLLKKEAQGKISYLQDFKKGLEHK